MNSQHHKHTGFPGILLILLVMIGGIGLITWKSLYSEPYYYRDPAQAGDADFYDEAMVRTLINIPDTEGVLDSITVQANASDISIIIPNFEGSNGYIDNALYEYHQMEPGEAFESEAGRIWLDHIAVAYPETAPDAETDYSVRVPARFFDANLAEITGPELLELAPNEWSRQLYYQGRFPTVRFVLKGELNEEAKKLSPQAYDARTRNRLHSGSSSGGNFDTGYQQEFRMQLWHAAPVELIIDLAFGPIEIFEFPAEPGQRAVLPDGEIMLLVKAENMEQRSSTSNGTTNTLLVEPKTQDLDTTTTCLVFALVPQAYGFPVDVELLDKEGNIISGGGSGTSGSGLSKVAKATAADIKTVRVKYYPHRKRLIFRIPEIPGLPEANRDTDNLFDVRIPYVRIRSVHEFREIASELTQLQLKGPWNPGGNAFVGPLVFEDITVKELVNEYAKLHGPTYGAKIDQEQLTIEFLDMSPMARALRLWETVKSKLP